MLAVPQQIEEYTSINIITRHPNYDPATTYQFSQTEDDVNTVFYKHYYYRSVIDDNIGNTPDEHPDKWLKWSISNRYAQIDLRSTTFTTWDSTTATNPTDQALITEFENQVYDVVSLGYVYGSEAKVEVIDSFGTVIYSKSKTIYNRPTSNNWFSYYFDDFDVTSGTRDNFFFRIPPVTGGFIRVTVTQNPVTFKAAVGYMVAGVSNYVGCSLYGASLGLDDNSIIEIDDFGVKTVKKRIASEYMDIDVIYPKGLVMDKMRQARDIFGKIMLFVGDETDNSDYEHLFILGYVESYNTILEQQEKVTASWGLKEVI